MATSFRGLTQAARMAALSSQPPPRARSWAALPCLVGMLLGYCVPFLLDDLVATLTGQWDCSDLVPRLRSVIDRFDRADLCRANTNLWVALYAVGAIYITAIIATFALNYRHLTLARYRAMPTKSQWGLPLGSAFFILSAVFVYLFSTSGRRRGRGVFDYDSIERYADHEILIFCFAASTIVGICLTAVVSTLFLSTEEA